MSDPKLLKKKSFSPDWLMRGVLTKLGDTFDRLTGRGWRPSSSLATSELIERLKKLLDSEIKIVEGEGRFVPHNIKLKMQWDKFSTDSEKAIAILEHELLTAAVDHINDNLYHTYAPLKLEVKPDYFTEGVRLLASFESFSDDPHEAELNVTIPGINVAGLIPAEPAPAPLPTEQIFDAIYSIGAGPRQVKLVFGPDQRKSIGRTAENDLPIDDHSVSKVHASLVVGPEGRLMVADTGSTNGTFVNGERISYGKAYPVSEADVVKFGQVEVRFEHIQTAPPIPALTEVFEVENPPETVSVGEFEFRSSTSTTEAITPRLIDPESAPPALDVEKPQTTSTPSGESEIENTPSITEAFSRDPNSEPAAIPRPTTNAPMQSEVRSIDWDDLLDKAEDEKENKE